MKDPLPPISKDSLKELSKLQLVTLVAGEQHVRQQYEEEITRLKSELRDLNELKIELDGSYARLREKIFSPSSEKRPKPDGIGKPRPSKNKSRGRKRGSKNKLLPSQRYPNLDVEEEVIDFDHPPGCESCGEEMSGTQMSETSEVLQVEPRRYFITRYFRKKYRCSCCHSQISTAPLNPRIVPGSSYSDELIIDAALSKYCDLIPMERYCTMASRQGVQGIPPQSLIGLTHKLADFLLEIYSIGLRSEVLRSAALRMDETPHKMLELCSEQDVKKSWYLWLFASEEAAYFEYHDTRSGDVVLDILLECEAEAILTDDFAGYSKAVRITNEHREADNKPELRHGLCNAHARRKFVEAAPSAEEAAFYIEQYREIYNIEREVGLLSDKEEKLKARGKARVFFDLMNNRVDQDLKKCSQQSDLARALNYLRSNFLQLTLYITILCVPIDNNSSERMLRCPVIGRKTWYGTHSKRGAETAAVLFSIVESCKLCGVNPREYFPDIINRMHEGKGWLTPAQYRQSFENSS